MKKVFDRTYPGYGPWQVLESPHALRADSSRQRIILSQSMALPTIPGCIDNVVHEKVEQRQTCNVYTSSFTSGFHWADGKGGDAVLISQESLNKNKRKGILMTAMGRLKKFEDTAGSSSSKCFHDERQHRRVPGEYCFRSHAIKWSFLVTMFLEQDICTHTFVDVLLATPALLEKQATGEGRTDVTFVWSLKEPREETLLAGDKKVEIMDNAGIMFFEDCFLMTRTFAHMHKQDNDAMSGYFWQVGIEFVFMSYCMANVAEAATRIVGVAKGGGEQQQWQQSHGVETKELTAVVAKDVINFVKGISTGAAAAAGSGVA